MSAEMAWLAEASEAQLYARLGEILQHPADKLPDLLALPEPIRTQTITDLFADAEWTKNPDYSSEVLAIVGTIGGLAGAATGVGDAATAFAGLVKAL
jgi:hypothetical protein